MPTALQSKSVRLKRQTIANATYRKETLRGEEYWVLPVVLIAEGVHNGLFYSEEELNTFPEAWNGQPLPIAHPMGPDGQFISANSPEVEEKQNVGRLYNIFFEDKKLKGEAWINISKAKEIVPNLLERISNGEIIEVSTGLLVEVEETTGVWQSEDYWGIVHNIRPDHLAILLDQKGAYSVEEGGGLGRWNHFISILNQRGKEMDDNAKKSFKDLLKSLARSCGMEANIEEKSLEHNKEGENAVKEQIVNDLIGNEQTHWAEEDREALMKMEEGVLNKMLPKEKKAETPPVANEEKKEAPKADALSIDPKEIANSLKSELQQAIREAVQNELAARDITPLINQLAENEQCPFSKEALQAMPVENVQKIAEMLDVKSPVDYSLRGNARPIFNENKEWDGSMFDVEESK